MNTIPDHLPEIAPPVLATERKPGMGIDSLLANAIEKLRGQLCGEGELASELEEARAAVAELIAERNRLANTVRSHEKQIIRMTGERAELVAKTNAYLSAEDDYQADYYSANSAQLYADKQNARAELDAALARCGGAA